MCEIVCGNYVKAPWIFQLVLPFIALVLIGLMIAPNVESTVCKLCGL